MAYIGKTPTSGDFVLLDSITTSATASYTMQKNSVNFTPQSANHMIVSLNGTIQAPVSSFTVSGSTITFASALTSSDVIDFVLVLGNVNDVGVASSVVDSAITKNKTDFITDGSSAGVTVKGSGSDSGSIALNCSSNSHAIQLISPDHSAGQSYKLKLPDNNVTADKFIKVKSITGSGATATGQLEFAEAGGGAWTLLETESTASGSAAIFTSMSSTYHTHAFVFETVRTVVDNDNLRLMVQNSSGDTEAIYYGYERFYVNESGGTGTSSGGAYTTSPHNATLFGSLGSGANEGCSGIMYFTGTQDANDATLFWGNMNVFEHNNQYGYYQMHGRISNSVLPNIRFYGGGGNFEHGNIRLYGIK